MKRKTKKSNGRLQNIRFILIAVILVASLTQIGWMNNQTDKEFVYSEGKHDVLLVSVTVHQGDTLWKIASASTADNKDVRSTVYAIVDANNLGHNQDIYPGQVLKVPVSK